MWLGNPYRHTVLKCSMKMYLKVIGGIHVILAFLKLLLLLECPAEGGSWYPSDCSTSTHDRNAKTKSRTYTYMQTKEKAKKQYNNT